MVAVSKDGEVFTWGAGDSGQLGLGERVQGAASPQLVPGIGPKDKSPITSVCGGAEHTLVISSAGIVYAFGDGSGGRLGLATNSKVFSPQKIRALEGHPIGQTACGARFSLAISKTGSAAFWFGEVAGRQLDQPERIPRFTNRPISQCVANGTTGMFLVGVNYDTVTGEYGMDSSVYSFGMDPLLHGHGDDERKLSPFIIEGLEDQGVTQVALGPTHAGALTADGRILMWGNDDNGELGSSHMVTIRRPVEAISISGFKYTYLAVGDGYSAAIAVEDNDYVIDGIEKGQPGPAPPPSDEVHEAVKKEGDDLQALLDQFAVISHKYDLMNMDIAPPPPPDDDDDIPPPPPEPQEPKKQAQQTGGKRILPPGSEDIGNGWLRHTDKVSGKHYYENTETKVVQWTAPTTQ